MGTKDIKDSEGKIIGSVYTPLDIPPPDQAMNSQTDSEPEYPELDVIVDEIYSGHPYDFLVDRNTAREKLSKLIAERERLARIDELSMARNVDSQFSSADIVNHLESRLAELRSQERESE